MINALRERLERELRKGPVDRESDRGRDGNRHCAALPLFDPRGPDEILGYDKNGPPR